MHFCLVDAVLERSDLHIVTVKQVSAAEEYLQDHFPGFPVLPGVLMLEAMVQAGRELVSRRALAAGNGHPGPAGRAALPDRLVLGEARALKYGRFVKPGQRMRVNVTLHKDLGDGRYEFKGEATVHDATDTVLDPAGAPLAVSGRFTLRPPVVG